MRERIIATGQKHITQEEFLSTPTARGPTERRNSDSIKWNKNAKEKQINKLFFVRK